MRISTYVVVDPALRGDVLDSLLRSIAESRFATLQLETVDEPVTERREVNFGVRQMSIDDFDQKHFIGIFYEEAEKYVINVNIPPWDEDISVKISPFPSTQGV